MEFAGAVDKVISEHIAELTKPGVVSIRLGYQAAGQWLTKKPAIAVTVNQKQDALPPDQRLQDAGIDLAHVRIQANVHNKGMVVDSAIAAVGSQNWSADGVIRNRDATLIIYNEDAAKYWEQIFIHDWTNMAVQQAD